MVRRLPAVYAAAVVAVAIARALTGHPSISALALTPDRLAEGRVWLLPSSAVVVNGPVLAQLVGLLLSLGAALRRFGGTFTALVMVTAHVGATLLAYAVLAVFTGDPDGAHNPSFDYGVSAVWLGLLGALAVTAWRPARGGARRDRALLAVGATAFVVGVAFFPLLSAVEHRLAFVLGALAGELRERRSAARRLARSGASTAFGPAASA